MFAEELNDEDIAPGDRERDVLAAGKISNILEIYRCTYLDETMVGDDRIIPDESFRIDVVTDTASSDYTLEIDDDIMSVRYLDHDGIPVHYKIWDVAYGYMDIDDYDELVSYIDYLYNLFIQSTACMTLVESTGGTYWI